MAVDYGQFIAEVRREAALPSEDAADRAARAALQTLGERLTGGEARDLARHLPEALRSELLDGEQPEPFDVDEYLHRVARREGVEEPAAARHALAVFTALGRAAGRSEIRDMEAELPKDFRVLVLAAEAGAGSAGDRSAVSAEQMLARVAQDTGLDLPAARRAAEAVLDALGERISGGQVSDLAAHLPDELARALNRGNARSKGQARPLSVPELVRRVSDLEGVPPGTARAHARAVFAALRETVGEQEFADTVAQLPAEYRPLVDPASADGPAPQALEVHAPKDLPREELGAVRERLASLQGYVGRPILYARLTLRHPETRKARSRWIADASIDLEGRPLAAHATGPDALAAADAVVDRLRRQVRRVVGAEVALRNDPRVIAAALGELAHEVVHRPETDGSPAGRRRIVHRGVAAIEPASIADAAADLLDADQEFRLFRHDETGEWLVIHRREDGRLGVVHPPWVPLTDGEDDILVVQPSPYDGPLTLEEAEAELAATDNRFRYFVDAADERPKVLYVRHDGDYGLVEPLAGA